MRDSASLIASASSTLSRFPTTLEGLSKGVNLHVLNAYCVQDIVLTL